VVALGELGVVLWSGVAGVVAVLLDGGVAGVAVCELWSVAEGAEAGLAGAFVAGVEPWASGACALAPGAVEVELACWSVEPAVAAGEVAVWPGLAVLLLDAALWSAVDPLAAVVEDTGCADASVLLAGAAAVASAAAAGAAAPLVESEACWLVQVSEILLTEVTVKEPSLPCVPWTCTFCPSYCLIEEASPARFTLWPLSEVSVQFPPDCLRQPVKEFCPLAGVVLVGLAAVLSVLLGLCVALGLCELLGVWVLWSGAVELEGLWALPLGLVDPALPLPPACANAMPEASIIAKINFLFMSVAPSKSLLLGCRGPCAFMRNKSAMSG
jgi:hypothetical protein